MQQKVESSLETVLLSLGINRYIAVDRAVRFAEFCLIGALGMIVDLSVTLSLLDTSHYLLANFAGFLAAVSFNFAGNWWLTYDRTDGNKLWQYISYVVLHGSTFAARALVVLISVEYIGLLPTVATILGVSIAAILNFVGNETIFRGDHELWLSLTDATNHIAHILYSSRFRDWLIKTGFYNHIFTLYGWGLNLLYRQSTREINVNGVSATFYTEHPTETVSIFHSVEKERTILQDFVADISEEDTVLDVGGNLGVYSCLAGQITDDVVAVDPHEPTINRCEQNMHLNGMQPATIHAALGDERTTVELAVQNDAVGTQRPEVSSTGTETVWQFPGDGLKLSPDVIKIDVEGAEHAVLDGLNETVEECRLIYLEAHDNRDAQTLRKRLVDRGFAVDVIAQDGEQQYLRAEQ